MTLIDAGAGGALRPRRNRPGAGDLPEALLLKFGSPRARPRLTQVYDPRTGWSIDRRKVVVTVDLLRDLRESGITLVEAKWRRRRRQINLSTFDFSISL